MSNGLTFTMEMVLELWPFYRDAQFDVRGATILNCKVCALS